jgi:hypothetical protein
LLFKWNGDWRLSRIFLPADVIASLSEGKPKQEQIAKAEDRLPDQPQNELEADANVTQPDHELPAPESSVSRAVLYEEDPGNPQGKQYLGSAAWRTETVSSPGLPPELQVSANIEIPERHITATLSLRRNTDKALPASHTIEIAFYLPPHFLGGGIANVPGVLMKESEGVRGMPLAGLAVKVTRGFFLVGLSAVDTDIQRNTQLLKEQPWFDIPIVYNDGRRAILAIGKGDTGRRAIAQAFAQWPPPLRVRTGATRQ